MPYLQQERKSGILTFVPPRPSSPPLALLLAQRGRWLDRAVITRLHERGWPTLTSAQSLVFASLDSGGTPLATLTERLGTTRQSTHELVAGLDNLGLLTLAPDQNDSRRRTVELTSDGRSFVRQATAIFAELEHQLAERLGPDRLQLLRETLAADWGSPHDVH